MTTVDLHTIFPQAAALRSHWHDAAKPFAGRTAAALPKRVPHVILGAGIAGAAAAWELTGRGVSPDEILVIDANPPAFGASGRNAGFVLTFPGTVVLDWISYYGEDFARRLMTKNTRNRQLVLESAQRANLWQQKGGSFYLAASEPEMRDVLTCGDFLRRMMPHSEIALVPSSPHFPYQHGALFRPGDFAINPVEYVHHLLEASNVPVLCGCIATDLAVREGCVELATSLGTVLCGRLYVLTNAYVPLVLEFFRGSIPIHPRRNQVMLLAVDSDDSKDRAWGDSIYYANEGFDFWRQLPDGRILLGGAEEPDLAGENTVEVGSNETILAHLRDVLAPKLALGRSVRVERSWSGVMGFTADEIPVCGTIPETDRRVAYAVGFSGYGLGLHRTVIEDMLAYVENDLSDTVFSPNRFRKAMAPLKGR